MVDCIAWCVCQWCFFPFLYFPVLKTWFLLLVASSRGHVCSLPVKPTLAVDQKRRPAMRDQFLKGSSWKYWHHSGGKQTQNTPPHPSLRELIHSKRLVSYSFLGKMSHILSSWGQDKLDGCHLTCLSRLTDDQQLPGKQFHYRMLNKEA